MAPPLPHLPSPPREVRHDLPQCPRAMFQVAPRNGTSLGTWVHCDARPCFATRGFVLKISNTIKHLQFFIDYYGLLWFIIDYYRSKYYILIDYYHLWLLYSFLQFVRSLLCLKISPAHTGTYRHQFRHVPTSTAAPFVLRSTPRQWVPAKPKGLAREDQVESSCESFWKTDISPCQIVCIIYIYYVYIIYLYT